MLLLSYMTTVVALTAFAVAGASAYLFGDQLVSELFPVQSAAKAETLELKEAKKAGQIRPQSCLCPYPHNDYASFVIKQIELYQHSDPNRTPRIASLPSLR